MILSHIVATSENNVIGLDSDLPWRLPRDMKFFKEMTTGHHILMGRKNFECMPKALPNRTNIVISRREGYTADGAIVFKTIEEGIAYAKKQGEEELFIIGGGEIYKQTLHIVDRIYLTLIKEIIKGDTFYPELDLNQWKCVERTAIEPDAKNNYAFDFITFERKK